MTQDAKALEAVARAYDREDASQRGEPDPWVDGKDDAVWVAERLACASAALFALREGEATEGGDLVTAAVGVLASWDERMHGEREELRNYANNEYWSPRASLVDSSAIAILRAALTRNAEPVVAAAPSEEPVAWMRVRPDGRKTFWESNIDGTCVPVYLDSPAVAPVASVKDASEALDNVQAWVMQQRIELRPLDPDFHAKYETLKAVGAQIRGEKRILSSIIPATKGGEVEALKAFAAWVDTWVRNPVGAYSVSALDGLFSMTRDKLAALSTQDTGATPPVAPTGAVGVRCRTCLEPAAHLGTLPKDDGGRLPWPVCDAHLPTAIVIGWRLSAPTVEGETL